MATESPKKIFKSENDAKISESTPEPRKKEKTVTLVSTKGFKISLSVEAAKLNKFLETIIGDDNENDSDSDSDSEDEMDDIPCPAVDKICLTKIVDFSEHYILDKMGKIPRPVHTNVLSDIVGDWYASFVDFSKDFDLEKLFKLTLAANYMSNEPLLDLCCAKVASLIKGHSVESIRKTFNVEEDFTAEEEAKIREENPWLNDHY